MNKRERIEELKRINDEVMNLTASPLYKERIKNKALSVTGEGDPNAKIMFIGEAPGKREAESGKPFCGAAGRVLNELLVHIEMKREDVYITNIVKDRPPGNRDPSPEEISIYAPFLDRQIEIIQPKVLATLGRHAMRHVLSEYTDGLVEHSIGEIHGKEFETKLSHGGVKIVPLYHPAVAIYQYSKKDELKKDFEILKKY